jgi:hypothetical protein
MDTGMGVAVPGDIAVHISEFLASLITQKLKLTQAGFSLLIMIHVLWVKWQFDEPRRVIRAVAGTI